MARRRTAQLNPHRAPLAPRVSTDPALRADLPLCMLADAVHAASEEAAAAPLDKGMRYAKLRLAAAFQGAPDACLTFGSADVLLAEIGRRYPGSAAASVLPRRLADAALVRARVASPTSGRLLQARELARLAGDVVDQESYQQVVEANGLGGQDDDAMRARAFVRFVAELAAKREEPGLINRIVAQLSDAGFGDYAPGGAGAGAGAGESEPPGEPAHDEGNENSVTVDSPITGQPLVLELSPAEPEEAGESGMPDMAPGEAPGALPSAPPLPAASGEGLGMSGDGDGDLSYIGQMQDLIEDPSAPGKLLEVHLEPHEESEPSGEPVVPPAEPGGIGGTSAPEPPMNMAGSAPPGREKQVKELKKNKNVDNPFAVAWSSYNKSASAPLAVEVYQAAPDTDSVLVDRFQAPHITAALVRVAQSMNGTGRLFAVRGEPGHYMVDCGEDGQVHVLARSVVTTTPRALTAAEAQSACAQIGLTAAAIETVLLDGRPLHVQGWTIALTDDHCIAVGKTASSSTAVTALHAMDEAIADYQALVAQALPASVQDLMLYVPIPGDTDRERSINARRMVAAARSVVPNATGAANGQSLELRLPSPSSREAARVQQLLSERYAAREIVAQYVGPPPAAPPVPVAPATPPASPYQGAPPVAPAPAGQAMQPNQAPQQTMAAGQGALAAMIDRHSDPLDPSKAQLPRGAQAQALALVPESEPMPGSPMVGQGRSELNEKDKADSVAAFTHYRNQGYGPVEAMRAFALDYKGMLDGMGPQGSQQRVSAESALIGLMSTVYEHADAAGPEMAMPMAAAKGKPPWLKDDAEGKGKGKPKGKGKKAAEGDLPSPAQPPPNPNEPGGVANQNLTDGGPQGAADPKSPKQPPTDPNDPGGHADCDLAEGGPQGADGFSEPAQAPITTGIPQGGKKPNPKLT